MFLYIILIKLFPFRHFLMGQRIVFPPKILRRQGMEPSNVYECHLLTVWETSKRDNFKI